ncbi:MAG TPA: YggT family protein [Anaerolineae bacterium]
MLQLIGLVQFLFELYSFILLARVLLSWFQVDPYNPLVRALFQLTEPVLEPIRRLLPSAGMLDFSPIVAFIAIRLVETVVINILLSLR